MSQFDLASFLEFARSIGTDVQEVEVKEGVGGLPKSTVETISAFANGSGGTIVCGISEREGFVPAKGFSAKAVADALGQRCSDAMEPPVRPDITFEPYDGATVVVAQIPETLPYLKPCYVKARGPYDGSFIRASDGDRRLSRYEVDRIMEERRQPRYDEELLPDASLADLSDPLVRGLLEKERASSPFVFGSLSDDEALLSLKVVRHDKDGELRPTLAGIMALGKHPQHFFPRCSVSFAVVPGISKEQIAADGLRFYDSKTIIGPIPVMVSETMQALRSNTRTASYVQGAGRHEIPDYPEVAVREAVANALMHRDYSPEGRGSQVQVTLYEDRLEVSNPGGLYGSVTIDRLGELDMSSCRNQLLSRLLESTPFAPGYPERGYVVENKGTGYFQIVGSLRAAGMAPPEPQDNLSSFYLTIRGRADSARQTLESDMSQPDRLTETDAAVLEALQDGSNWHARELADELGISGVTASRSLRRLVEAKKVDRLPRDGTGIAYRLRDDNA